MLLAQFALGARESALCEGERLVVFALVVELFNLIVEGADDIRALDLRVEGAEVIRALRRGATALVRVYGPIRQCELSAKHLHLPLRFALLLYQPAILFSEALLWTAV